MLRGELPFPPIAETLDFSLISVEAGNANQVKGKIEQLCDFRVGGSGCQ